MKMFYFTFEKGQTSEGKYQPIKAPDGNIARMKMFEIHGSEWDLQYTEEQWKQKGQSALERLPLVIGSRAEFKEELKEIKKHAESQD